MSAVFDRDAVRAFRFVDCGFDAATGVARLVYAFDDGPELVETVTVPGAPFALDDARAQAVTAAVRLLHLIAGVSYYKAAVPAEIRIDGYAIDAGTAALLESVYVNGLGEFAYRNGLDLHGRVRFPVGGDAVSSSALRAPGLAPSMALARGAASPSESAAPADSSPAGGRRESEAVADGSGASPSSALRAPGLAPSMALARGAASPSESAVPADSSPAGGRREHEAAPDGSRASLGLRAHALVAIGGGKDSLVSIEALRAAGVAQTVTWIGGSQLIRACAERTGLPTLNIQRQLAPELFEYNRLGAYNGHIPVTAINSAILALAALVRDADQVVFSNERSASYGSLITTDDGRVTAEVNHQWSKGWAFEQAFGDHLRRHVAADLHYYSLLRPLSELAVARQFAKTDRYDAHFSSCNRNFHLLGERPVNRWCGVCPKCHFVFLALAPFMPKPRLVGIFGRNLLDDPAQTAGYDALLEYRDHKPFECVGEARESRAALAALTRRPEWREDALVRRFAQEIAPQLAADELEIEPLLVLDDTHRVPPALWDRLRAHLGA